MTTITKKQLIAAKEKLEKNKIPKNKDGKYVIKIYKPDKATIELIKKSKIFELE